MKQMRYIALALSMAVLLMTLTACGGGGEETPTTTVNADGTLSGEATDTLNVYMCAEYLNEDAANELIDQLTSSLDMFSDGGVTVNLTCVATGSGEDPTMQMAGMMKLTAAIAAQEVDVVIADEANAAPQCAQRYVLCAQRPADRGRDIRAGHERAVVLAVGRPGRTHRREHARMRRGSEQ